MASAGELAGRRTFIAAALIAAFLAVAPGARAQLPDTLTITPPAAPFNWADSRTGDFEVHMTTGAEPAEFTMRWDSGGVADTFNSGSTLAFGGRSLEGPGTLIYDPPVPLPPVLFIPDPAASCTRGQVSSDLSSRVRIQLPPGADSVLRIHAALAAAPWVGARTDVGFSASAQGDAIRQSFDVGLAGPFGLHIRFDPRSWPGRLKRRKRSPRLTGTTVPPTANARIRVGVVGGKLRGWSYLPGAPPNGKPRTLGTVTTAADGSFVVPRTRLKRGIYRVVGEYLDSAPGLAADTACGPYWGPRRILPPRT
jgi:hypothetical protein